MLPRPKNSSSDRTWLLRRGDQAAVAACILAALVSLGGYYATHRGSIVEIDRADPQTAAFKIDINKADPAEFAQVPGIGKVLAQRIVQVRQERGGFVDHQDLTRVRGIGTKTLERMRPYLLPMPEASSTAGR